jgi:hypothetical protein
MCSSDLVALVMDNGYCWNSDQRNKRASIGLCDSVPVPIQHILTYAVGCAEDFFGIAEAPDAQPMLSSCHERILHGASRCSRGHLRSFTHLQACITRDPSRHVRLAWRPQR